MACCFLVRFSSCHAYLLFFFFDVPRRPRPRPRAPRDGLAPRRSEIIQSPVRDPAVGPRS